MSIPPSASVAGGAQPPASEALVYIYCTELVALFDCTTWTCLCVDYTCGPVFLHGQYDFVHRHYCCSMLLFFVADGWMCTRIHSVIRPEFSWKVTFFRSGLPTTYNPTI